MAAVVVCSLSIALASGQAVPEPKPQMAEDVFKNVLVLKGIPVDEFMDTMGMISASLNLTCSACHTEQSLDSWDKYADDTPRKQTTRRMILMVNAINKNNFGGARILTCYTCHRGDPHPKFIPSLAVQYGAPTEDPNEVFDVPGQFTPPDAPSADQIFDKYLEALGGAQRVANLTSFAAKGTYEGYDTEHEKVPMEVFAKAPAQRTTIVHMPYFGKTEDSVRTYDGRAGWIAAPDKPVTLIPLTGGSLEGAKIEAILSFPARARQAFSQWRVSSTTIDDRDVWIVQGTNAGQPPVKFYFNQESGLLMRLVRYSDSPIGRVPTQIDYDDYRAVSGVKMPFRWTTTWTGGQTIIELGELQANVPIDAAKFARPAPAPKH
jgi:hypothetical protein